MWAVNIKACELSIKDSLRNCLKLFLNKILGVRIGNPSVPSHCCLAETVRPKRKNHPIIEHGLFREQVGQEPNRAQEGEAVQWRRPDQWRHTKSSQIGRHSDLSKKDRKRRAKGERFICQSVAPTIVIYDSRVETDLKLPHTMTLES